MKVRFTVEMEVDERRYRREFTDTEPGAAAIARDLGQTAAIGLSADLERWNMGQVCGPPKVVRAEAFPFRRDPETGVVDCRLSEWRA